MPRFLTTFICLLLRPFGRIVTGKRASLLLVCLVMAGCSMTTLRCGVDGEMTYVDIVNVPQDLAGNARYYAQLCGFAYDSEPVARLNIIDGVAE